MSVSTSRQPDSTNPVPAATVDLEGVKARQQTMWSSGNYAQIGTRLQIVGELLAEAIDLQATEKVIDVAAGNGNAALAAARRFADVTAIDYVPELLEQARARAMADGLTLTAQIADAERLPFGDGHFDVALSTFGIMFTPDQHRAASELARVVRPGGRIGLANWTPEGFIGQLFRLMGSFVPPPAGVASPLLWGTETRLVELFGPRATDLRVTRRHYAFRYRSAEHWIEVFRTYYGPTHKAFAALDGAGQRALHAALLALLDRENRSTGGSLVVPAEYLEVIITTSE